MRDVFYEATHSHPGVLLDSTTGLMELSGRSIPENATIVYRPVMEWLDDYVIHPCERTVLNFKIEFFNTSSSKFILLILKKLEELYLQNFAVEIHWFYNDEDILDLAKDYDDLVKMKFCYHKVDL